jgi:peptide/nickel transport system substrate-binding protein
MKNKKTLLTIILIFIMLMQLVNADNKDTYYGILELEPEIKLDPLYFVDVYSSKIARQVYSRLVKYNDKLDIVGDIAERFVVSKSKRNYIFYIRKGVLFHNSIELTSDDVIYSIKRLMIPNNSVYIHLKLIKKIIKINNYMIKIVVKRNYPMILDVLTSPLLSILQKNKTYNSLPIGTGPFKVTKWEKNKQIVLERVDNYFGEKVKLKNIIFIIENDNEKISI